MDLNESLVSYPVNPACDRRGYPWPRPGLNGIFLQEWTFGGMYLLNQKDFQDCFPFFCNNILLIQLIPSKKIVLATALNIVYCTKLREFV